MHCDINYVRFEYLLIAVVRESLDAASRCLKQQFTPQLLVVRELYRQTLLYLLYGRASYLLKRYLGELNLRELKGVHQRIPSLLSVRANRG